jgi:hypothetical protein
MHYYALADRTLGLADLLSEARLRTAMTRLRAYVAEATGAGVGLRLTELNSIIGGGACKRAGAALQPGAVSGRALRVGPHEAAGVARCCPAACEACQQMGQHEPTLVLCRRGQCLRHLRRRALDAGRHV